MEDLVQVLLDSAIFVLPLWFGNAAPTVLGGGAPIDRGRLWRDGKRILGDGKTIRGFWAGVFVGGIIGGLIELIGLLLPITLPINGDIILRLHYHTFLESGIIFNLLSILNAEGFLSNFTLLGALTGSLMTFGGLIGDLVGSFIKRRSGIERGKPFIFLDQLGFLIFGMVFVFPLISWPIEFLLVQVPITFVLHIGANLFGYFTGIQDEPL
ncbi:MAG: CDP-archaeol synthase [Candidatus Heimdallarchaeota archaeon]|nr:MAG: CDP-archaeol synthase [Candidatus Heimdallarchaeota archaeon]